VIETALLLAFGGTTLLQLAIWLLFPARWVHARPNAVPRAKSPLPSVSVIICARNEAHNLRTHLPFIIQQQYASSFEVLVVNDNSEDATLAVLADLAQQFPHLKVTEAPLKIQSGKKAALTAGVHAAQFDWLVLTDADCQPASPHWLTNMMEARIVDQPGLILGYAPNFNDGTFWNRWARFETAYVAMQYFSTAHWRWPFMGVGRNLAWHRDLFWQVGGFAAHQHIASGDDDLFVNQAGNHTNTTYCDAPESFVYSAAKNNFSAWLRQKSRHLSAGLAYAFWQRMVLGGVAFTHAGHYGFALLLLWWSPQWWSAVVLTYFVRLSVVWVVYFKAFSRLKEQGLTQWVPLLDAFLALWLGAVAPTLLVLGHRGKW
jgi:poly-beta-1,6-N-acetyl-D-glucosamine synthase